MKNHSLTPTTRSVRQLLGAIDLSKLAAQYVALRHSGSSLQGRCPISRDDDRPLFFVMPSLQTFRCLGCGAVGNALDLVMQVEHLDVEGALRKLQEFERKRPRKAGADSGFQDTVHAVLEEAAHFYAEQAKTSSAATDYLKARGVNAETAARFMIGYAPNAWDSVHKALHHHGTETLVAAGLVVAREGAGCADFFRARVMFPIRAVDGRVIAFGGRVLTSHEPKYLNSPDSIVFHKGAELYGLYECAQSDALLDQLIVVEGYMDVLALWQNGIRQCVATLGTATTPEHVRRLFVETNHIVFCFDGDQGGRNAGWRALECAMPALRAGRSVRFMRLPDGEDPDSFVRARDSDAFLSLVSKAPSLCEYVVRELAQPYDLRTLDGRASWLARITPLLAGVADKSHRAEIAHAIADRAGVGVAVVESLADAARQKVAPSAAVTQNLAKPSNRRPKP